jgi:hypothetical protein
MPTYRGAARSGPYSASALAVAALMEEPMHNNDQANNESQYPEQPEDLKKIITEIGQREMLAEVQQSRQVPPPPQQTVAEQLRAIIREELAQAEQRILTQMERKLDQLWKELTRGGRRG